MASGGEMRGFVFCVTYLIVFSALLSSIPVGLQGAGTDVETLFPIDPSLTTGFSDYQNWTRAAYTGAGPFYFYDYSLDSKGWYSATDDDTIQIVRKIYTLGFLWLGQIDPCKFISPDGTDRGTAIALTTINSDADDGAVRYDLESYLNGESAGSLVAYWNTTKYDNSTHAWDNQELYLLHGVGIDSSATNNVAALLVGLLFFQLPDVPPLVNAILATPTWACVIFILWFVIKEMIPFI